MGCGRCAKPQPQLEALRSRFELSRLLVERTALDTFPDLGALSDSELKDLIQQLTEEEQQLTDILAGKGIPADADIE